MDETYDFNCDSFDGYNDSYEINSDLATDWLSGMSSGTSQGNEIYYPGYAGQNPIADSLLTTNAAIQGYGGIYYG